MSENSNQKTNPQAPADQNRSDRLKDNLRTNLQKRKNQARARAKTNGKPQNDKEQ